MVKRIWKNLTMKNLKNSCQTSSILMNSYHQMMMMMILSCMSGLMKIRTTSKECMSSCSESGLLVQNSSGRCYMPVLYCCFVPKGRNCFWMFRSMKSLHRCLACCYYMKASYSSWDCCSWGYRSFLHCYMKALSMKGSWYQLFWSGC